MAGKLIIFSAPSGAGKTTIVKQIVKQIPGLEFSISACNRAPRNNEQHAVDYYFLTDTEFKQNIDNNAFVEWEEVYTGRFYGTLKSELERIWAKGNHVLFDVDVLGGVNLKKQFGNNALSIFIKPPNIDILRSRLINRATDTVDEIEKRVAKAGYELTFANQFDIIILNDNLDKAINETSQAIIEFLTK